MRGHGFPYYKAVRLRSLEDVEAVARYHSPRVLVDAYAEGCAGGTGRAIPGSLVLEVKERRPLWLAGGIGPENVAGIIRDFHPELIDASSRLEKAPGVKDLGALKRFFEEVNAHASGQ